MDQFYSRKRLWQSLRLNYVDRLRADFHIDAMSEGCVIFGAALLGRKMLAYFKKMGISVKFIVDNDV